MRRLATGIAVLAATVLLTGCGFGITLGNKPPACTRENSTTDSALSKIDPEGISCIVESHRARFDMSSGAIDKSSLGVPDDEYAPDVSSDDGLISLEIVAPGGIVAASSDRIRFFTTDSSPVVDRITYFLVADTQEEFFELIREGVDLYGIDSVVAEEWIESVKRRPDVRSDFAFDSGTALGLNVDYDLRYDETKSVQVIIVQVSPM